MSEPSLVSVVDDDESVRESLPDLLRQFGFAARAFSSAEAFLASEVVSETSCLILDVAMPGMSGPDLQLELIRRRQEIPIVFITAQRRQCRPSAPARAGRRGVPVQAVQRDGPARRTQRRASSDDGRAPRAAICAGPVTVSSRIVPDCGPLSTLGSILCAAPYLGTDRHDRPIDLRSREWSNRRVRAYENGRSRKLCKTS